MSKIEVKKMEANKPGKDRRNQKPDFKGKIAAIEYKKAIQGRSKLPSKKGTQQTAIKD
jgi:hypothetical protein